jgi:cytochrome P450
MRTAEAKRNFRAPFLVSREDWDTEAPPGPVLGLPLAELQRIRKQGLISYLQYLIRRYGNVTRVKCGPVWVYVVNEPEMIRDILQRKYQSFEKGYGAELLKDVVGLGVLAAEGDDHRRQRKLMQPAFHKECLRKYAVQMQDCIAHAQESWEEGAVINIAESMNAMTLDVVVRSLFSTRVDTDAKLIGQALGDIFEVVMERLLSPLGPFSQYLPTASSRRYRRAVRSLDEIMRRLVTEHQSTDTVFDDLMAILVGAQDEEGRKLSFRHLRDEAMTLFIAGHETTAIALSWAWYEIARNPEIQQRLQAEVDTVLSGRTPGFEDASRLPYCRALMKESMRMYPPVYVFLRQAAESVVVGDYLVPKGAHIFLSPYLTHRDARFYPNPEHFAPERWTAAFEEQLPKFAYFPFSGGPRVCLGEHFAWTEGILALATLAQKWHFTLEPHQSIRYGNSGTLRPEPGIDMRVHRRAGR